MRLEWVRIKANGGAQCRHCEYQNSKIAKGDIALKNTGWYSGGVYTSYLCEEHAKEFLREVESLFHQNLEDVI